MSLYLNFTTQIVLKNFENNMNNRLQLLLLFVLLALEMHMDVSIN